MLTEKQLKNYWGKVDVKGEDDCWNWTAYSNKGGYGQFGFGSPCKNGQAHRVSAYIAGFIPNIKSQSDNDQVLHKCDNRKCQNPKHFFIGTNKNNSDDRDRKGRGVQPKLKGVEHGRSKLTEEDVLEIRRLYAQGGIYQKELANIYNVGQQQICHIVNRKRWAHI